MESVIRTDETPRPTVVLGSTGQTGGAVATVLETAGHEVRRASRRSEWRFDWDDESTWTPTFTGAGSVYIVLPEQPRDLTGFRDRLIDLGVGHVVVLTARNPQVSGDGIADGAELAFSGGSLRYTFIRPAWFAQNFVAGMFSAQLDRTGELRLPVGAGKEPFVDFRDIADVAAAELLGRGTGESIVEVSGGQLLGFGEAVDIVGRSTDRDLRFTPIELDEWQHEAATMGIPTPFIGALSNLFTAIANRRDEYLSHGVRSSTGRSPRTFQQTIDDALAAGPVGAVR